MTSESRGEMMTIATTPPKSIMVCRSACGTVPVSVSPSSVRSFESRLVSSPTRCSPKNFIGSVSSVRVEPLAQADDGVSRRRS